jgi:hypothetical protein
LRPGVAHDDAEQVTGVHVESGAGTRALRQEDDSVEGAMQARAQLIGQAKRVGVHRKHIDQNEVWRPLLGFKQCLVRMRYDAQVDGAGEHSYQPTHEQVIVINK